MNLELNVLISAITAWIVTTWIAKRRFDAIDRYVEEITETLKDVAKRLGLISGDADIDKDLTERR